MIIWLAVGLAGILAFAIIPIMIGLIVERLLRPLYRPPRNDRDKRP
ncbi:MULTISPECIES: hypothetical protein [unclassified Aurantimonas]|nr:MULTISPECIES: hypothetical protein [unclassified Aurantimonas]MEC5291570.1 hypothetical protein [Aurantimonas sp. C2-3-R2]MEC5412654.1 hypothetical protein [Aurantimonas sp. C2-4-R8]